MSAIKPEGASAPIDYGLSVEMGVFERHYVAFNFVSHYRGLPRFASLLGVNHGYYLDSPDGPANPLQFSTKVFEEP